MDYELIKKYFYSANYLVLNEMYLKHYKNGNDITVNDLKESVPGHLGSSLNINFILANLYYFLNHNKLTSQIIIGAGHAGAALNANQFLLQNGNKNIEDINEFISGFGSNVRSEINPTYADTIYAGGELGYSLAVAYGYALTSKNDIVPVIIGDGESETGTLSSSLFLNKIIKSNSKVLPIINLNGLKMSGESYLSLLTDDELKKYYEALGYNVLIVDGLNNNINKTILYMQRHLSNSLNIENPLIIVKTLKGYSLPKVDDIVLEGNVLCHKNPLDNYDVETKLKLLKSYLKFYDCDFLNILNSFDKFDYNKPIKNNKSITRLTPKKNENINTSIKYAERYLNILKIIDDIAIFSPDEILSNKMELLKDKCIEILNENVLQGLLQGNAQAGNNGIFIGYEGFMNIISSQVNQYIKFLKENKNEELIKPLNYLLTSNWLENCYSHQNTDFIDNLLLKDDNEYNILFPKNGISLINALNQSFASYNQINIINISKRGKDNNFSSNIKIEVIEDNKQPDLILCATGDYMLEYVIKLKNILKKEKNVKIIYVTTPKILDVNSTNALNDEEFNYYFNKDCPVYYYYAGNPNTIKSLLFERKVNLKVFGYQNAISYVGNTRKIMEDNGISFDYKLVRKKYEK